GAVPQQMQVNVSHADAFGRAAQHLEEPVGAQRRPALAHEHVARAWLLLPVDPPQGAYLEPAERLHAVIRALAPEHLQPPRVQIDLLPAERHKLADAQAVAVGHQDHRGVPMPPAAPRRAASHSWLTSFSVRYSRRGWSSSRSVRSRPGNAMTVPLSVVDAVSLVRSKPAVCFISLSYRGVAAGVADHVAGAAA